MLCFSLLDFLLFSQSTLFLFLFFHFVPFEKRILKNDSQIQILLYQKVQQERPGDTEKTAQHWDNFHFLTIFQQILDSEKKW